MPPPQPARGDCSRQPADALPRGTLSGEAAGRPGGARPAAALPAGATSRRLAAARPLPAWGVSAWSPVAPAALLAALLALGGTLGCAPASERQGADRAAAPDSTAPSPARPAASPTGPFVRVVGTVQDGGLPHAACTCPRCELARADPARRRWITSLALVLPEAKEVYLFDATPDLRQQLDLVADVRDAPAGTVDRAPLDGVFLTHAHIGHYLGLAFLGYEAVHTSSLPVWATPRMAAYLRGNGPWSQLVSLGNLELREIAPGGEVELAPGVRVRAFRAPHRDEYADTLGFVLEGPRRRLLYLPDTDSWTAWEGSEASPAALVGEVDYALLDGTFYSPDELPGRDVGAIGHPLITTTMDLLQELAESGRTEIYFTHLNHSNPALDPDGEAARAVVRRGFHVLDEGREFAL